MDLYAALVEKRIPVTEKCIEIADTCDLCGKCDMQCYFVTEMKPTIVMRALKKMIKRHTKNSIAVRHPTNDPVLMELQEIVGDYWATNDLGITVTYSSDPCPLARPRTPEYVIMPN